MSPPAVAAPPARRLLRSALHAGRIVADGHHDELVAAGGRYAQLWAAWSGPRS